jgi:NADPH:quinone reductase
MQTQALRFYDTGSLDVLKIDTIARPQPGRGQVLIDVHAFALNRADILYFQGQHYSLPNPPSLIGSEAAGIVEAVGEGVTAWHVGDRVATIPHHNQGLGVHARHALFDARYLARWPEGLSAEQATSTWMEMLTAYYPLIETAKLTRGDKVLIAAASSSAGLGAIAIAKDVGATVIATTRTRAKVQEIASSGADHVIATDEDNLASRILEVTGGKGVRVVYDPIAGDFLDEYVEALDDHAMVFVYGVLRSLHAHVDIVKFVRKAATVYPYSMFNHVRNIDELARGVAYVQGRQAAGAFLPKIDKVFKFDDAIDAYRHMLDGKHVGKIVVSTRN